MVLGFTDDFEVTWQDPADAGLRWGRDRLHLPRPLPPLAQAYGVRLALPVAPNARIVFVNGYAFVARPPGPPPGPPPARPANAQDVDWQTEVVPKIRDLCLRIRDGDYESMSAVELAGALDRLFADAVQAFQHTMEAGRAGIGDVVEFFTFCERHLPPDGMAMAATMTQGYENDSAKAAREVAELTQAASARPQIAEALRTGRFDNLLSLEGGAAFVERLRGFLDEYGWRTESWSLTHIPVPAEDPRPLLKHIADNLDAAESPLVGIQRAARQRDETIAEAEKRLAPEERERFRELLAVARGVTRLSEGRAFWQLTAAGVLCAPLLALGRKLVHAGVVSEPNDIFFLYLDEVRQLASDPQPMNGTIQDRKADFQRWERLSAPSFIGSGGPPPGPPPDPVMQVATRLVLGMGLEHSVDGNVIKGTAAGRGEAEGRARIIRSLDESDRLNRGEILVCQTTSPAWTALFAVAAAVVTDSGGILSHSAICAREFGIPCVVGAQVATSRIPDGAFVKVDGSKGTVTILGGDPA
jgi:phosphohistidine swiveling domain-containing protein